MDALRAPTPRRAGVDVDGVLADLHRRFLYLLNKDAAKARDATGAYYRPSTLEDVTDWDTWKALPILRDITARFGEDYASALCWRYFDLAWLSPHKMKPIPGAPEAMRALSKRSDLEIEILTSRRPESTGDMMAWLSMQRIPATAVVTLDAHHRYKSDKSRRSYDVFIDDSPGLARRMAGHPDSTLLLFDRPYNQGTYTPNVRRVGNWRCPETHWQEVLKYFKPINVKR